MNNFFLGGRANAELTLSEILLVRVADGIRLSFNFQKHCSIAMKNGYNFQIYFYSSKRHKVQNLNQVEFRLFMGRVCVCVLRLNIFYDITRWYRNDKNDEKKNIHIEYGIQYLNAFKYPKSSIIKYAKAIDSNEFYIL